MVNDREQYTISVLDKLLESKKARYLGKLCMRTMPFKKKDVKNNLPLPLSKNY